MSTRAIAIASFLFTVAFFIEYTPLARRVHIPFDLESYYYPLADYAFQSLRQGRVPQWDPTIYCGLPFAGNAQSALFYPPTWLLFALNVGRTRLSYQSLQTLTLAHLWLAFLLCWLWLRREKALHPLAAALGAGVFAFSGHLLLNLQHFGLIAGCAWMPLGFWGIDAARRQGAWRPLWRLVVAAALCFLAGYPSIWIVFAVCMLAYACGSKSALRDTAWTAIALTASLALTAVQLLPAWEATRLAVPETRYDRSSGIKDPAYFISYIVPNFYDFGLDTPVHTNPGRDYLYLGAAAFVGAGLLLVRGRFAGAGPPVAVLLASLLFFVNPFGLAGRALEQSALLSKAFSAWYFLAGVTAAAAMLAALGLDYGLKRAGGTVTRWLPTVAVALSIVWSIRLIVHWNSGSLAAGWLSSFDAFAAMLLFGSLLFVYPGASGRLRTAVAFAALALVATEYKAFGTSQRFNAYRGPASASYTDKQPFPGMNPIAYAMIRTHPEYRVALDQTALFPQDLRHNNLTTPQGFDPLLPMQYKALIDRIGKFRTNREFDLQPENTDTLRLLGVRYFVTSENGPLYKRLSESAHFRLLFPDKSYHKVFEMTDPHPVFEWETTDGSVEVTAWIAERRGFRLRSARGGRFRLSEQFFPGWSATVDETEAKVELCQEAFQCVEVPAGRHRVEFRYHSRWLLPGALISLCSILLLAFASQKI